MTDDRDPRSAATVIGLDLSRSIEVIDRDLLGRWPSDRALWWELEPDEQSGWVYSSTNKILAKLVHHVSAVES